jgi:hypothetical protein
VSASVNISASAFYGDGSALTNLPGGGGIFTELDSSNAYSTSSLSIGTSDAPGATLHVSSSGDEALFRVDGLTETEPVLFVTGSRRVGIGTATPAYELDVNGNIAFGNDSGLGYLISRGATNTKLKFGADGADSIALLAGNVQLLLVDNDSPDKIVLGAAADNNIIVTGSLIVNGSISGSTTIQGASLSVDGSVTGGSLTDGTATISGGAASGFTTINCASVTASAGIFSQTNNIFPGAILAYSSTGSNSASALETFTPTSTSFAYVDFASAKVNTGQFTVPAGGNIEVEASMWVDQSTTTAFEYFLRLALSSTDAGWTTWENTEKNAYLASNHILVSVEGYLNMKWHITGLTPGTSTTLYLGAAETNTDQTHTIKWGEDYPAIIMKVTVVPW